jgi:hypothetical protein
VRARPVLVPILSIVAWLYAGYGFWLFQRAANPNGGMVAYRLP